MASPAVNTATGSTITFETGFFAQLLNVSLNGIARPAIKTSHFGSTAGNGTTTIGGDTFIPGDLANPGTMECEFHFNPDTTPPIMGAAATVTLTIAGSATPATWACSGFMTEFSVSMPLEDKMVANATIQLSGVWTLTDGT